MPGHWLPQRRSSGSHPPAQGKPRVLVVNGGVNLRLLDFPVRWNLAPETWLTARPSLTQLWLGNSDGTSALWKWASTAAYR